VVPNRVTDLCFAGSLWVRTSLLARRRLSPHLAPRKTSTRPGRHSAAPGIMDATFFAQDATSDSALARANYVSRRAPHWPGGRRATRASPWGSGPQPAKGGAATPRRAGFLRAFAGAPKRIRRRATTSPGSALRSRHSRTPHHASHRAGLGPIARQHPVFRRPTSRSGWVTGRAASSAGGSRSEVHEDAQARRRRERRRGSKWL